MTTISPIIFNIPETGGFLVRTIAWLISSTTSVALGIVLFTLILKLITLPFDLYSKVSMRKNSLKMEAMRPELEKLQKQYANDKVLYNQKMMALYKRNGYSMWGACLPTILTLVIFIVAINAFSSYSRLANQENFYQMSLSYNSVVFEGVDADGEIFSYDSENKVFNVDQDKIKAYLEGTYSLPANVEITTDAEKVYVSTTNGFIVYQCKYSEEDGSYKFAGDVHYVIDTQALKNNANYSAKFNALIEENNTKAEAEQKTEGELARSLLLSEARERSASTFREERAKFFWVKNIWMPDSAFEHPIYSDYDKFVSSFGYDKSKGSFNKEDYNELIYNLGEEKEQANGYFILVVLTAGITLLSQIVMTKSQKAQMELQTVDGQGMQTQNMMKWMMPMMMGFFAFMYTAAFSIYIVLSSAFGMGITLVINAFVDRKFKNTQAQASTEAVRGRVYVPKEQPKEQPKKQEKKKKLPENDFLSGLADNKKGRR